MATVIEAVQMLMVMFQPRSMCRILPIAKTLVPLTNTVSAANETPARMRLPSP